jgi:ABC-type transport system involved in multi-copper enzyme maturation permease subunit
MAKVWAIAFNTFKEAVRNRILYILLIFAVVLLLFSGVARELTISAQEKIIRSLGLGCINIFGLLIAVFVGIGLVYNELDKKTIYTIISKPIDRWQFILGKYFGLLLTIYVNILIMAVFFYFSLYYQTFTGDEALTKLYAAYPRGQSPGTLSYLGFLGWAVVRSVALALKTLFFFPDKVTADLQIVILMTCLELAIITAFAILYSSFSTPTLSAILTVFTFVIGRGNEDIIRYTWYLQRKGLTSTAALIKYHGAQFVAHLAPNLRIFYSDTSYHALSDPPVVVDYVAIAYAVVYSALILSLAILIFRRRNFK